MKIAFVGTNYMPNILNRNCVEVESVLATLGDIKNQQGKK